MALATADDAAMSPLKGVRLYNLRAMARTNRFPSWALAGLLALTPACTFGQGFSALMSGPRLSVSELAPLAREGDVEAQLKLATMYYNGERASQDFEKAAEWYRKAAEQGSAEAQFSLGVMSTRGEGMPADPEQAARFYLGDVAKDSGDKVLTHVSE